MTCPSDGSFSARLENNQLIVENCEGEFTEVLSSFNQSIIFSTVGPAYSLIPRTETWGLPLKNDSLDR
jgi:hypothetical protein